MKEAKVNMSLADNEIKETLTWLCEETERIGKRLEAEGFISGLDSNREAYIPMHAEFARRMKAIGEKYGLSSKEK